MSAPVRTDTTFYVSDGAAANEVLLVGLSNYGFAGLSAVDYLVDYLDLEETGHVRAEGFPTITPFENGRPRRPVRLFSRPDLDVTVLAGELYVPPTLGESFAESILGWVESEAASDIAVLSGVPIPHAPDDHRTYYIATDEYRETRLDEKEIPPMGSGFLDGVNAALLQRGMESPMSAAVYVTPVHSQAPDVEAAIRLVEVVETVYELGIDSGPLKSFADEVKQYYSELAERLEEREVDTHEDRMYM